ncbi:MAG: biopolymer transporter ExbD [Betaproteobacteria bacterium RIFCSPLOWO2_02_FULL_67_26]|nr:MAG: biopolymer transporter ExbD [Betaproteobacteria bacterium RIFCSPLOWO2_02_FULL_67_26]
MRFRPRAYRDEPEINFIPLIDVLLVILIFLMVTTTYSRYAELQINLPTADATRQQDTRDQIDIAVDAQGRYSINRSPVGFSGPAAFSAELRRAAGDMKDPVIVISADANSPHQSVINVMEAARIAGYGKITFTTEAGKK